MKKLLLLPFLLFAFEMHAQLSAKASVGGYYYTGNVNKLDIRSDAALAYKSAKFEYSGNYKFIYSEIAGVQNNGEIAGGVKFDYMPQNKFSPFIALNFYNNKYKGYDLRVSSILGAKYVIYETEKSDYSISAAFQYDAENYAPDKLGVEIPNKNLFRLSIRPKITQQITSSMKLTHISFFRPNLSNFSDHQIDAVTSLSNQISKKFYIDIAHELQYTSKPVREGLKKTDQAIIVSLVYKL
ncbi:MAG TPA: hypothetical protein DCQ31_15250 [Bacteroidales bacterium]|nr:hypothetical protein [Bacteroidales bacterium]